MDVAIDLDDAPGPAGSWPGAPGIPAPVRDVPAAGGRGRTGLLMVGGLVLVAALAIGGLMMFGRGEPAAAGCNDASAELAGVWDDARRAGLRSAFKATGVEYADSAGERVATRLDAYAKAWGESFGRACEAQQKGAHTAAVRDLQVACLQRRRGALKGLVDALASADEKAVARAIDAAVDLPPVAGCDDVAGLAAATPLAPDPQLAATVDQLRAELEPARVALAFARIDEGLKVAEPLAARAHDLGYAPLEAEAIAVVSELRTRRGDLEAAEQTLIDAVWLADRARDDELLADRMAAMVHLVGERRGRVDEALRWRRHADTVRARLPAQSPGQVRLLHAFAGVLRPTRHDEAFALDERALAIAEGFYGPDDPHLREPLTGLGAVALARGDLAAARRYHDRAVTIYETAFGADHPRLGDLLAEVGAAVVKAGMYDAGLDYLGRALAIQEAALGKEDPALSTALAGVGAILTAKGDHAAARPYLERDLALVEKRHGGEHPAVVTALVELGELAERLDDPEAARTHGERALALAEKVLPADDPQLAGALAVVGERDLREGKAKAALPRLERALTIREERAAAIDPADLARSRYRLAAALRDLGREPERQQELVTKALAELRAAGPERHAELIAEIEGWAAATPAPTSGKKGKKKKVKKTKKKKKKK